MQQHRRRAPRVRGSVPAMGIRAAKTGQPWSRTRARPRAECRWWLRGQERPVQVTGSRLHPERVSGRGTDPRTPRCGSEPASSHGSRHPGAWRGFDRASSTRSARRPHVGSCGSCRMRRGGGNMPSTGPRRPGSCRNGDSAMSPRPKCSCTNDITFMVRANVDRWPGSRPDQPGWSDQVSCTARLPLDRRPGGGPWYPARPRHRLRDPGPGPASCRHSVAMADRPRPCLSRRP